MRIVQYNRLVIVFTFKQRTSTTKSEITNMTGKLFFTADEAGEHPGNTYFRDFALIPSGKLMLLLRPCTGMFTCSTF